VSPEWVPLPVPCGPGLLAREPARPADDRSAEVVVRPGDSLWSIAAARLGPFASDAEIADNWPRWYDRNAGVIGPDPGLLRPGQVLSAPEPP
jgi:nucleoid-associated protein YgaU